VLPLNLNHCDPTPVLCVKRTKTAAVDRGRHLRSRDIVRLYVVAETSLRLAANVVYRLPPSKPYRSLPDAHGFFSVCSTLVQPVSDKTVTYTDGINSSLKPVVSVSVIASCTNIRGHNANKKLSCRKETMRLLRGSFLAKCNWDTIFCGHYRFIFNHSGPDHP